MDDKQKNEAGSEPAPEEEDILARARHDLGGWRGLGCLFKGGVLTVAAIVAMIPLTMGLGYVVYPISYWLHDVNFPGVHESPVRSRAGMQWLDNDRIVFASLVTGSKRPAPADIVLWTVPEDGPDKVETLVEGQARSIGVWTFCYQDDGLVFTLADETESAAWKASRGEGAPRFDARDYAKSYRRLVPAVGPDNTERWSLENVERQVGDDMYCNDEDDPHYIDRIMIEVNDIRSDWKNSRQTNVGKFVYHRRTSEWISSYVDILLFPVFIRKYFDRLDGGYILTREKWKNTPWGKVLTGRAVRLTDRGISYPIVSPNGCRLAGLEDERRYLSDWNGEQGNLDYSLRVYDLCKHRGFFE